MQGAARCFEHSDFLWVQLGIRSLSASPFVLLLLSVVNTNRHVFFLLCRLFSSVQHLCQVGLRRECSLVATLFEGQWSALPTSAHSRGDGSLTGQGTDSVVAESREVFVVSRVHTTTPVQL